jgi:WD40 repeat protein
MIYIFRTFIAVFFVFPICVFAQTPENLTFVEIQSGKREAGEFSCFSPDSKYVIVTDHREGGSTTTSTVWQTTTGKKIYELSGHAIQFSPDGKYIAVMFQDWSGSAYKNRYKRWKRQNPQEAQQGVIPESFMWLKICDARTGQQIRQMQEVESSTFAFSNDGKSYMIDNNIWRTTTGWRIRRSIDQRKFVSEETDAANELKKQLNDKLQIDRVVINHVSLGGEYYAVAKEDKTVVLFDAKTQKQLLTLENATMPYLSPNGRFMIHLIHKDKSGESKTMRIYDLKSIIGAERKSNE